MPFFILLLFDFVAYIISYKMVIIFGEPQNYGTPTTQSLSFYDCSDYCYEMDGCLAVYSANVSALECLMFQAGQISTVKELSSGGKVAMKMNNSDATCPSNSDGNSDTTATTINEYNITSTNGIWTFSTIVCPTNFTMIERAAGLWCVRVIPLTTVITQVTAESSCSNTYGGVLSGLDTVSEFDFVVATVRNGTLNPSFSNYSTVGYWVNGARKTSCMNLSTRTAACNGTNEFVFTDPLLSSSPNGYIWGTQQPSGYNTNVSNCIHLGFNTTSGYTIGTDDYRCDTTNTTTAGFIGYVCGVRPING